MCFFGFMVRSWRQGGLAITTALMLTSLYNASPSFGNVAPEEAFHVFIQEISPICQYEPADVCVSLAMQYADADGDGLISLSELQDLQMVVQAWSARYGDSFPAKTRSGLLLGQFLVNSAGLEALFAGFDANNDGYLSKEELLQDTRLDERPLGMVLLDPDAVDRHALASRFGSLAPLLQQFFPQ